MKLTDSQLLILSGAAKRSDGSVLPLPKSVRLNKGAATLVLKSLLKHRLVAEQAAGHEPEAWRDDGDGNRIALSITPAGLNAIGIEDLPERTLEESATKSEDARSIVGSAAATEWIQHPLPISGPIPKNAKRKLDRVHRVVRTDRIESNPLGIHSDFSHIQLGECPTLFGLVTPQISRRKLPRPKRTRGDSEPPCSTARTLEEGADPKGA